MVTIVKIYSVKVKSDIFTIYRWMCPKFRHDHDYFHQKQNSTINSIFLFLYKNWNGLYWLATNRLLNEIYYKN